MCLCHTCRLRYTQLEADILWYFNVQFVSFISSSKPVLTFLRLCPEVDASNLVLASRLSSPDVLLYFLHLHLLGALGMMDEGVVWFSVALLDLRCLSLVILCCVQDATTKRSVWNAFFLNMFWRNCIDRKMVLVSAQAVAVGHSACPACQ